VLVSYEGYSFTVELYEASTIYPMVDGVDCRLEALIVSRISDLAETRIILDRAGPNRDDRKIVIGVPSSFGDGQKANLERGIMQAIVQLLAGQQDAPQAPNKETQSIDALGKRIDGIALELAASATRCQYQPHTPPTVVSPWWKFW
jgi:hypothetical protein